MGLIEAFEDKHGLNTLMLNKRKNVLIIAKARSLDSIHCINEWMYGGWMVGWMDGYMDRFTNAWIKKKSS